MSDRARGSSHPHDEPDPPDPRVHAVALCDLRERMLADWSAVGLRRFERYLARHAAFDRHVAARRNDVPN